jgi:nucleoid DNA-binding protein
MTRDDLTEYVCARTRLSREDSNRLVAGMLKEITRALSRSENVELRGLGGFQTFIRRARVIGDPNNNGQLATVPARRDVRFVPGKKLREALQATRRS